jgi:hypothetical protein
VATEKYQPKKKEYKVVTPKEEEQLDFTFAATTKPIKIKVPGPKNNEDLAAGIAKANQARQAAVKDKFMGAIEWADAMDTDEIQVSGGCPTGKPMNVCCAQCNPYEKIGEKIGVKLVRQQPSK